MIDDWRYNDQKLMLREQVYSLLLCRFGHQLDTNGKPIYSMKSITECSHDWVSQGNIRCDGIVKYFEAYYTNKELNANKYLHNILNL
jgi:hypothetical protein